MKSHYPVQFWNTESNLLLFIHMLKFKEKTLHDVVFKRLFKGTFYTKINIGIGLFIVFDLLLAIYIFFKSISCLLNLLADMEYML